MGGDAGYVDIGGRWSVARGKAPSWWGKRRGSFRDFWKRRRDAAGSEGYLEDRAGVGFETAVGANR